VLLFCCCLSNFVNFNYYKSEIKKIIIFRDFIKLNNANLAEQVNSKKNQKLKENAGRLHKENATLRRELTDIHLTQLDHLKLLDRYATKFSGDK